MFRGGVPFSKEFSEGKRKKFKVSRAYLRSVQWDLFLGGINDEEFDLICGYRYKILNLNLLSVDIDIKSH